MFVPTMWIQVRVYTVCHVTTAYYIVVKWPFSHLWISVVVVKWTFSDFWISGIVIKWTFSDFWISGLVVKWTFSDLYTPPYDSGWCYGFTLDVHVSVHLREQIAIY